MTSNKFMTVALKILGVYFLASSLVSLPSILSTYEIAYGGNYKEPLLLVSSTISYIIIEFFLGFIFAFKTNYICKALLKNEQEEDDILNRVNLSQIIQLMGLYILSSSFGGLLKNILEFYLTESSLSLKISMTVPYLTATVIGVLFVFKSSYITKLINEKNK